MKTDLSRISLSRVIRRSFFLFMLGYALVSCVTSAPTPVCTAGNCVDGQGTYTYANGDKYVGEWRDNLPNGQGTLTYADGSKYVGEWKGSKANGQGTMTYADGRKMAGIWENDEYLGK
ncbi:MAG TPA: hypothetical protein QF499_05880 [Gammaproteobacteria bacterium]|nr:hypothetical protein [Gammaproteobacteria bacterium]